MTITKIFLWSLEIRYEQDLLYHEISPIIGTVVFMTTHNTLKFIIFTWKKY